MAIREEGYGWRMRVYQLKKNFIADNLCLTLLPTMTWLGWAVLRPVATLSCEQSSCSHPPSAAAPSSPGALLALSMGRKGGI